MELNFRSLEHRHALATLNWCYPAPYEVYNFTPENRQADLDYLLNPQNAFFALLNAEGDLEGFCSFGPDGQVPGGSYREPALDIGMGMRPDLTGQGNGRYYAQAGVGYAAQRYPMTRLRVTIATFNQRAQRVRASLGFEPVETFCKANSNRTFVVMIKAVEGSMNPLNTDYISHDSAYQRLKAEGAYGWTSEEDHIQVVRPRILQAINQLSIPFGSRILDLGCGTGDIAIWLALQGYEAYGIDIAPSAIAWACEKAHVQQSQVQFTVGSVLDLAVYEDGCFHLVVDGRCLHCIIGPDRAATLASVYRVLQPGGGFLVQSMCGEVMEESPMKANFDPMSRCIINREGIATRYIGAAEDILEELTAAGFAIPHSETVPRQGLDDQDDLVALAVKPS